MTKDEETPVRWEGVVAVEGQEIGDGRYIHPDAVKWDDEPKPLTDEEGYIVGAVDSVCRQGGEIHASGYFDSSENERATALSDALVGGAERGVAPSADKLVSIDGLDFTSMRLREIRLVDNPAWPEATIRLVKDDE